MGEPANRGRRSSSGGMMMHGANLKRRFFVSLVLTIPVLLLSSPMGLALPITLSFPGSDWLVAVLATVLFAYGGWPFLRGAADELRRRAPAMMTLVALGITTAYVYSMYAFVMGSVLHADDMRMDFFWELATLIVIMLLGHWIEMRAVMGAGDALKEMAELLPAQAHVLQEDGSYADVPLDEVQVGQTVMVEAGEKVPADGEVTDGSSSVNEALVTGEARAVEAEAGDMVFGGSQNGDGTLYVRVTGTGQSGYLAQVMRLVSEAQQEKSHAEVLSDKVARWLFYAAVAGVGVKGTLDDGSHALIANARYLDEQGIPYERAAFDELAGRGLTVSYLVVDGEVCGVAAQGDQIKPTARQAVRELKARGVVAVMLTGDNEAAARSVARTLGIDEFRAGLLPQDKVKLVQQRRDAGDVVMMVGDGINDAPALARADVGVAIGAGTDVAIDSADVVLVKSDPEDIVRLLDLGTNTTRKIKQNLWWGAGYNIVAIPLAAGVLAPVGILLSPAAGAVLMSLSTVIVAVNAMTLKSD